MRLLGSSQNSRLKTLSLLFTAVFLGCAPSVTAEPPPVVVPLQSMVAQEQVGSFEQELGALGITVLSLNSFQYQGFDEGAFLKIIRGFYLEHPGFCPLENAFYFKENPVGLYMTVTAKGHEVAAVVYDQRQKPRVTYTVLLGVSSQPLITTCTSQP